MDKNKLHKLIIDLVDSFLEDQVYEFEIKVNTTFTEEEFRQLIGNAYDSSNGVINNDICIDQYVYSFNENSVKKLEIEYVKQDDKYTIMSIHGFNDYIGDRQ
jgi:hypothetical protein